MIPAALSTRRVKLPDGSTAYPYPWNGETVAVVDNASNVLEIIALFGDDDMPEEIKAPKVISALFADADGAYCACDYDPEEFGRLIEAVMWDICGVDLGGHATDEPLWDIEEDAAAIRASLRMAYGIGWDEVRDAIPWAEFVALIAGLPPETPLGCAMHYRNKRNRPKPDKLNKLQVAEFDRLHDLFKLHKREGSHDRIAASSNAMDDLALALVRKAG